MTAKAGTSLSSMPPETQYFLGLLESGNYLLLVPLVDGLVRAAIQGTEDDQLQLVAETGDSTVPVADFTGLYAARGANPFDLISEAAQKVNAFMVSGRLRTAKPLPAFVDWFGWCTWDAFYFEVNADNVRLGLQSFKDGGVEPKLLILDDGWLTTRQDADESKRLTSFVPDVVKFPGGLGPTVTIAKEEFGVRTVLAWHAMTGYWGGVDPNLGDYAAKIRPRLLSPGLKFHQEEIPYWGKSIGLVPKENAYRFFQDFHRSLRRQGIDGVKVDVQAQLEIVSEGSGGRVPLMQHYHEALEGSVAVHFQGNLINCMSCANEMIYGAPTSNLTRTSTDFWPNLPETHGRHLYINAQVGTWFGEFIHPDWDMFQSAHPAGEFHAAGRAVSGSPIYVSDKPGQHNFPLLKKLVLGNGSILRAKRPGRPTLDCLLYDPTTEDVLLKIFNTNALGGVIGVFNARYSPVSPKTVLTTYVRPSDVEGISGSSFAVYAHKTEELRVLGLNEGWELTLGELDFEIFTIMPVADGFAPLGLADKFNGGGAVRFAYREQKTWGVELTYGGTFIAYSETLPLATTVDGELVRFDYDEKRKLLIVPVPERPNPAVFIQKPCLKTVSKRSPRQLRLTQSHLQSCPMND
jgi:raffinose synthase